MCVAKKGLKWKKTKEGPRRKNLQTPCIASKFSVAIYEPLSIYGSLAATLLAFSLVLSFGSYEEIQREDEQMLYHTHSFL